MKKLLTVLIVALCVAFPALIFWAFIVWMIMVNMTVKEQDRIAKAKRDAKRQVKVDKSNRRNSMFLNEK